MSDLSGRTTIVVGASRGLGHGVASAIAEAGADVIAVSRTEATFPGSVKQELADGRDAAVAAELIERHAPDTIVLVAGAVPHMASLQDQTWETFAVTWETDVRISFEWIRAILRNPLRPGSRVIVFSSGAALGGSPLSGGYAGAKSTQRFIAAYAQGESKRAGLDITFTTVLPRFAPTAAVGKAGVEAYAAQSGVSVEKFLSHQGPLLTPEIAGAAVVDLLRADAADLAVGYVLSGAGAQKMS